MNPGAVRELRVAVIGGGFMARVHTAAARSAGVTVAGVLSSTQESSEAAAASLGVSSAYRSLDDLLGSDVDVIHVCSPNVTHAEFAIAALEAGRSVVCEKPIATTVRDARAMASAAYEQRAIATVPFVYRFHPMVREARARIAQGELGRLLTIQGSYLQDWLLDSTDDNWRVDAEIGGASRAFADIGSHLCDLIEFITGDRIDQLQAHTRTVHGRRGTRSGVTTEDLATVMFETVAGSIGTLTVSQLAPGRKNRLAFEISGTSRSMAFDQEAPETLWMGERFGSRTIARDSTQLAPDAARLSRLPAGHPQGYQDAFNSFIADTYASIVGAAPDGLPTFDDGLRAALVTEAVLNSARSDGARVLVPKLNLSPTERATT